MPIILWLLGVPLVVVIALMITHVIGGRRPSADKTAKPSKKSM
jgi:hypothetical protein